MKDPTTTLEHYGSDNLTVHATRPWDSPPSLDLRTMFPLCGRYALRQTLPWLLALLALSGTYLYLTINTNFFAGNDFLQRKKLLVLFFLFLIVAVKYAYAHLYGRLLEYRIEGYRLVVSRGVILKTIGSVPLSHLCEAYVKRDFWDFLTGLYQFELLLSVDPSKQFVSLPGFSRRNALGLQSMVTNLINRQVEISAQDYRHAPSSPGYVAKNNRLLDDGLRSVI